MPETRRQLVYSRYTKGFGASEIVVSLVFLVVLGALVGRFIVEMESPAEQQLRKAREGIILLNSALGAYSFDLQKRSPLSQEGGLQVLVDTGYLESIPNDPWGKPYQYDAPAQVSGAGFDLYSLGPDGILSEDDIVNWNLYGKPYVGTSRIARKRDRSLREHNRQSDSG